MKPETDHQREIACTLTHAARRVCAGDMTENEFHVLIGLYALADGNPKLVDVSHRYLCSFLCGENHIPRIRLSTRKSDEVKAALPKNVVPFSR